MSEKEGLKEIDISSLLRNYIKAAARFWWILALSLALFATLLPMVAYWRHVPVYKATCSFTVRVVNASVTESLYTQYDIYYDKDLAEQLDKTFTYILTSDHLADEVRQELDKELEAGRITAKCIEGSNLFELTVLGSSSQEAYEMLVTVMDVFPSAARYVVGDIQVEIVEEPEASKTPANQVDVKGLALKGALIGFGVAAGILAWIACTVRTVSRPESLEEVLNMSCLGVVPGTRERTNNIAEGEFRESIRGVSRKVEITMEQDQAKVLLVTSTSPGEGKSLMSRYVAQTLAEWGKRVCLVDCDLRRPSQRKMLKCDQQVAQMESYLSGQGTLAAATCKTSVQGLSLIGNNHSVAEPTVLLNSKAMQQMITQLRNEADYVILDSPPCNWLSDVTVLKNYADQILYVVRQDHAALDEIVNTVQSLTNDESKLMGFVMNFAEKTAGGYGKYGYGSYSYGKYGNGYYGKYGQYTKYSKYHNTEQAEGISEK